MEGKYNWRVVFDSRHIKIVSFCYDKLNKGIFKQIYGSKSHFHSVQIQGPLLLN